MPLHTSSLWPASEPDFNPFSSRRSVIHSARSIVASTQPLATACGIEVLSKGGNCADAAVAVAAGLNVTEPGSTGIGGDIFCLYYDAKTKKVHSLNGSGRSGEKYTAENIRNSLGLEDGENGSIHEHSVHATIVPGAAAGWVETVEKFGSGKLSLEQILAPAVRLAEDGFPVSEISAYFWNRQEGLLRRASPNGGEMLKKDPSAKDGVRAPRAGELMKLPELANTFKLLGKHGKAGFYQGAVAEAIVKVVNDLGGHLTLADLEHHMTTGTEETEAISLNFKTQNVAKSHGEHMTEKSEAGVDVWEHPPNGQGIVALMALGIIEQLEKAGTIQPFTREEHNSTKHLHVVLEALRISFADAHWWVSDPNVSKVPVKELLSPEYLAERAKLFSPDKASDVFHHGSPALSKSDTVYLAVTDSEGNGISFINSTYGMFAGGIVPKGCGFTVQNRGFNFVLQPADHPNIIAPRKRPYHTIIPAVVTNASDQSLHSIFGVMGGAMQPQGHVQVLLNQLVFGLNPQAALDAPRVCIGAGLPEEGNVHDSTIYAEDGLSEETVEGLKKLGHHVKVVSGMGRSVFGRGQVIRWHLDPVEKTGLWSAGSDQRGDGAAVPFI